MGHVALEELSCLEPSEEVVDDRHSAQDLGTQLEGPAIPVAPCDDHADPPMLHGPDIQWSYTRANKRFTRWLNAEQEEPAPDRGRTTAAGPHRRAGGPGDHRRRSG